METFSALLAICAGNSPVTGYKSQWRIALIFSLIYAWINGWVNNGEAADLRRRRSHYVVSVMYFWNYLSTYFRGVKATLIQYKDVTIPV